MKQILALAMLIFSVGAKAQTYAGVDQNGKSCGFTLADIQVDAAKKHGPCYGESDGPGPWCNGQPSIYTAHVTGKGAYVTAAGMTFFTIDDNPELDENGRPSSLTGDPTAGGYLTAKFDESTISVYFYFPTAYGQTLTQDQINQQLTARNPDYQTVWTKIYTDETCTISLQ